MQSLLLVIELLIAIALIGVVLLQRSEGGALGMGGGGGGGLGGLFSPRGASDALTRTTAILAVAFFVVNIALSQVVRFAHKEVSPLDSAPVAAKVVTPEKKAPAKAPAEAPAPKVPTRH